MGVYILGGLKWGWRRNFGRGGVCAHLMFEPPALLSGSATEKQRDLGKPVKAREVKSGALRTKDWGHPGQTSFHSRRIILNIEA